jgi:hypothetical protein
MQRRPTQSCHFRGDSSATAPKKLLRPGPQDEWIGDISLGQIWSILVNSCQIPDDPLDEARVDNRQSSRHFKSAYELAAKDRKQCSLEIQILRKGLVTDMVPAWPYMGLRLVWR